MIIKLERFNKTIEINNFEVIKYKVEETNLKYLQNERKATILTIRIKTELGNLTVAFEILEDDSKDYAEKEISRLANIAINQKKKN